MHDSGLSGIHADLASADRNLAPKCSKLLATTLLPGPVTTLAGLGLVLALLFTAAAWANVVIPAGRGPPDASGFTFTGRELLTRYCIARR